MVDYVLMPEEATPEMEQAAEKYWNDRKFKALSDDPRTWKGLYAVMRAVAPVVQGEPLGYVVPRMAARLGKGELCGISILDQPEDGHTLPVYLGPQPAEEIGEVVVTKDKIGNIVSVTRQDAEGRVLSVIAESDGISQSGVLAEGYFHPLPDESDYEFHDAEQFPDGSDCPACVPAVIVRRSAVENQPAPDVAQLVEIAKDIVDLHAKRKVVLTVHVEALEDALAAHRKQGGE